MTAHPPEPPQRGSDSQTRLGPASLLQPPERRAEVVMLGAKSVQPGNLIRAGQLRLGCLRQGQEIVGVRAMHGVGITCRVETLQPVLADRLQHREARLAVDAILRSQQTLLRQRVETVEDVERQITRLSAN